MKVKAPRTYLTRVAKQGRVGVLEPVQGLDAKKEALRAHELAAGTGA